MGGAGGKMLGLRPCPFCGEEAELIWNEVGGFAGCFNDDCTVSPSTPTFYVGDEYKTEAAAEPHIIRAWNTRAEPEIVRCRDCKRYMPMTRTCKFKHPRHGVQWRAAEPDAFCAWGEKAER